MEIKGSDNK